jgi:hypothetical protein
MPIAMAAAFRPETPAPIMATLAACTPGTPPIRTPRPPWTFISAAAPTCGASRDGGSACSDIRRLACAGLAAVTALVLLALLS